MPEKKLADRLYHSHSPSPPLRYIIAPATPQTDPTENYLGLAMAGWLLALGGWGGLAWLLSNAIPDTGPRWFFFVLWLMALTGTAIPFVRYLNRRFGAVGVPPTVLLRQSL